MIWPCKKQILKEYTKMSIRITLQRKEICEMTQNEVAQSNSEGCEVKKNGCGEIEKKLF
jgi:hypothetical protein